MKRHISIFALLLCAFAAVGTAGAAANNLLLPQNVLLEGSSVVRNTLIVPKGSWASGLLSGSRVYESILSNGLKVVKWEYAGNQFGPWSELAGQSGTNITWTYRSDMSYVYLRPWLEWLHYLLSYDANSGIGTMKEKGPTDVRYDTKVSLPACGFTKTGYSFAGWSLTAKAGGAVWPAGTECDGHDFGVDAQNHDYGKNAKGTPVTLYAQWTPNQYTVTFDANCADGSSNPASKPVTYDSTYGELPTPTRPGKEGRTQDESWQFDGWYDSSSNKVDSTTKVSITNDVSLYAHWTEKFEVKYVDAPKFHSTLLKTEYVLRGGTATPPDNPEQKGYTFQKWTGYNDFLNVGQDRTYTAEYTGNGYKVIFHSCLVPDETHSQDFTYGESKALSPNTFVNAGHTFLGWAETAGLRTVKWKDETPVTDLATGGEVHLYAVWDANAYQIVFDCNGGSGEMDPIDMRYGVATNLPPNTFIYDGLDFKSWRDELNKTNYLDGATVSNLTTEAGGTVTLKAVWFEGYFVEFRANGGSGEMPRQQFARGVDTALPPNAFTKKGYTFTHWTNTQGKVFLDGAVVKDLATMGETAALYAVWAPNKYYVKFDDNGANWGEMAVQEFTYDKAQELTANAYGGNFLKFRGWASSPDATTREYANEELISNLTDIPNATNVLYAVWQSTLSDLSEAADCANLNLKAGKGNFDFGVNVIADFIVDAEVGYQSASSCRGTGERSGMTANLSTSGTLTFWARVTGEDCYMVFYKNNGAGGQELLYDLTGTRVRQDSSEGSEWRCWQVRFEKAEEIMWFGRDQKGDGAVWVDAVVWEPDGVTLCFDANGGADAPADLKIPLGSRDKLPREVPTRSGYAFRGWRLGSDTEKLYQPRETYTAGSEIATITFTAVWEPVVTNAVPVAVMGLVYDGTEKTGVLPGANYTITGNVATNAGRYTATATVTNGVWEGGATGATNIAWTIAKATHDMSGVTFASATYEFDGEEHSIAVAGVPSGVEVVYTGDATNRAEVGTNTVTASFKVLDDQNYNAITTQMTATLAITAKEEPPEPTVAYENIYFKATLAELGAEAVPTNRKITIKAEGLPKGLKLVTTTLKDAKNKVTGYAYTVEGAPTETMDGLSRIAYVRVTDNKVQTLYALDLSVLWAKAYEDKSFPDGEVKSEYANFSVTSIWPDAAAHPKDWTFSGWPAGIKFATKAMTSRKKIDGVYVTLTNALAYEIYGTPTKAGRFTVKAVEKIAGTSYKSTHVATLTVWPQGAVGDEWTDQAYVAVVRESGTCVKSASGLPTGVKFTAKDVVTKKVLTAKAHTFYGTPTKAGTYVVTLTHEDKSKTQFLWTITPADAPSFELKLTETAVDPETAKATIRLGVAYDWTIGATAGATVTASGLPTGLKLVKTAVKSGTKIAGYDYSVSGVPTKAGEFFVTFTTKLNGVSTVTTAAFTVLDLPAWAQGTFDGGADETFAAGGQATLTVSKAGKLSGKWMSGGTNWTLSAASYDHYDSESGSYVALMIGKTGSGKKAVAFTNELFVSEADAEYLGGVATNALFIAYQSVWKAEPWKTIGKKFTRGGTVVLHPGVVGTNDTITLKFAASGTVTVAGKFETSVDSKGKVSYYSVSASAVLCPQGDPDGYGAFDGAAFVYFPPKAKTPLPDGYSACVWVHWDGTAFAELPPASDE